MGIRAITRDIVGIYLGSQVVLNYYKLGFLEIDVYVLAAGAVLLAFGVWFLLERVGVLPKFM